MFTSACESTSFRMDDSIEHEECPDCKGGTLSPGTYSTCYSRRLTSSGGSEDTAIPSGPVLPCHNKNCYDGHLMTAYERKMQQAIYDLAGKASNFERQTNGLRETVRRFESSNTIERARVAVAGKLTRYDVINLPDQQEPLVMERS